jgi:hypothetical protein
MIRQFSAPSRYLVTGWVGGKRDVLHYWTRRRDAERLARLIMREGYSEAHGGRYTRVTVTDRFNRVDVFEITAPRKTYGG